MKGAKKYDFKHRQDAKFETDLKFHYLFKNRSKYSFEGFCGMNINTNSLYNMY